MARTEPEAQAERADQRKSDHQRWADDDEASPNDRARGSAAAPAAPLTVRWQLLTNRLELRARWLAFCTHLAQRSAAPEPKGPQPGAGPVA